MCVVGCIRLRYKFISNQNRQFFLNKTFCEILTWWLIGLSVIMLLSFFCISETSTEHFQARISGYGPCTPDGIHMVSCLDMIQTWNESVPTADPRLACRVHLKRYLENSDVWKIHTIFITTIDSITETPVNLVDAI